MKAFALFALAKAVQRENICPSKYVTDDDQSGCYEQDSIWDAVTNDVECEFKNPACLQVTCNADGLDATFRHDLFHEHNGDFVTQLAAGDRWLLKKDDTLLQPASVDPKCGYTIVSNGVRLNWKYADCLQFMDLQENNGLIEYSVTLKSPGNEPGVNDKIEFYVDTKVQATCAYDPNIELDASFWVNQEDVEAAGTANGTMRDLFRCSFYSEKPFTRQTKIRSDNIVNMGETIWGLAMVKRKNGQPILSNDFGLWYELRQVRFCDASNPGPTQKCVNVIDDAQGLDAIRAETTPNTIKKDMKKRSPFSFMSFGFEGNANQNALDITCSIRLIVPPAPGISRGRMERPPQPKPGYGSFVAEYEYHEDYEYDEYDEDY